MDQAFTVLDGSGEALDPARSVTGRLSVARQPAPWKAVEVDPNDVPTHLLAIDAREEAIQPRYKLEDAAGNRWVVLHTADHQVGGHQTHLALRQDWAEPA